MQTVGMITFFCNFSELFPDEIKKKSTTTSDRFSSKLLASFLKSSDLVFS